MTTYTTQTAGLYADPNYNYRWNTVQTISGTSVSYTYAQGGLFVSRSNSGTNMTDTLPLISNSSADNIPSSLNNGWFVTINNTDTSAILTVSPSSGNTIAGVTSLGISPGGSQTFYVSGPTATDWSLAGIGSVGSVVTVTSGAAIVLSSYGSGTTIIRSNATSAMTDTLVSASGAMPKGWYIWLRNNDASATDTVTPATSTINGGATLAVTFGKSTRIYTDGTNYFANTPA